MVNTTAFSAQVRKRTGYMSYSTEKDKMVTTYYLVNSNGARVSTQEYDYLSEINSNLFIAMNGDKYGLIDGYGRGLLPFEYQEIKSLKYGVIKVKQDNKYGLMTFSGSVILPISYSYLEKIDDRLLKFSSGVETLPNTTTQKSAGNIGLMDYRGNVIASEQYISVDKINNYLLRVRVAGGATGGNPNIPNPTGAQNSSSKYGIIDYSGRTVLSPQYDYISNRRKFSKMHL